MRMELFENSALDRHDACEAMKVKTTTLHGWLQQGLIRHRQRGTGRHLIFTLPDLFRLGVARNLIFAGLSPKDVIPEIENRSRPYTYFCQGIEYYEMAKTIDGEWTHPFNTNIAAVKFSIDLFPIAWQAIGGVARVIRNGAMGEKGEELVQFYLNGLREFSIENGYSERFQNFTIDD